MGAFVIDIINLSPVKIIIPRDAIVLICDDTASDFTTISIYTFLLVGCKFLLHI